MITFAENPVKLLRMVGEDKVRVIIIHTEQILTVPIDELEANEKRGRKSPFVEFEIDLLTMEEHQRRINQ